MRRIYIHMFGVQVKLAFNHSENISYIECLSSMKKGGHYPKSKQSFEVANPAQLNLTATIWNYALRVITILNKIG